MKNSCPAHGRPRYCLASSLIQCALLLVFLGEAGAGPIPVDGLDQKELRRARVAVALIRAEGASKGRAARKIKIVDLLFGARPPTAALERVQLSKRPRPRSDAPHPGGGRLLIMCWIRDSPCGPAGAVSLGPWLELPLELKGEAEDRLSAVRSILSVVGMVDRKRRTRIMVRHFRRSSNAHLVLMADAALSKAHRHHRFSAARYLRLLSLASGAVGEDEVQGEGLLRELLEFPAITTSGAYRRWRKSKRALIRTRSWAPFTGFRARVQSLLKISVRSQQASTEQRHWALQALARPPSFIAARRDPLDQEAAELMEEMIRDTSPAVRRSVIAALLSMIARARRRDRPMARRLGRLVQQAQTRENSPAERRIIQRLIREGAGGKGR